MSRLMVAHVKPEAPLAHHFTDTRATWVSVHVLGKMIYFTIIEKSTVKVDFF